MLCYVNTLSVHAVPIAAEEGRSMEAHCLMREYQRWWSYRLLWMVLGRSLKNRGDLTKLSSIEGCVYKCVCVCVWSDVMLCFLLQVFKGKQLAASQQRPHHKCIK